MCKRRIQHEFLLRVNRTRSTPKKKISFTLLTNTVVLNLERRLVCCRYLIISNRYRVYIFWNRLFLFLWRWGYKLPRPTLTREVIQFPLLHSTPISMAQLSKNVPNDAETSFRCDKQTIKDTKENFRSNEGIFDIFNFVHGAILPINKYNYLTRLEMHKVNSVQWNSQLFIDFPNKTSKFWSIMIFGCTFKF